METPSPGCSIFMRAIMTIHAGSGRILRPSRLQRSKVARSIRRQRTLSPGVSKARAFGLARRRTFAAACGRSGASRRGWRTDRRRTCRRRWRPNAPALFCAAWRGAARPVARQAAEIGEAGQEAEHGDLENHACETLDILVRRKVLQRRRPARSGAKSASWQKGMTKTRLRLFSARPSAAGARSTPAARRS